MPALDNAQTLIIGITDYANIGKLPKVRDAQDLAVALVDPTFAGMTRKTSGCSSSRTRRVTRYAQGLKRSKTSVTPIRPSSFISRGKAGRARIVE